MSEQWGAKDLESISGGPLMDRLIASDALGPLLRGVGVFVKDYVSGDCIPNTLWKELGYTAAAMRGKRWKRFVHPDDRPMVDEFEHLLCSGAADYWAGEFRIRSREGSYRTIKHKAVVLERAVNAVPRLYVGWDVDVTEYVERTEKALRASETLEQRFLRSEEIRTAGAILSSELDPLRSADRILVQARRVIPFDAAVIWTEDAEGCKALSSLGLEGLELTREMSILTTGDALQSHDPVVSSPLSGPFASRLEVPLLRRDRLIGYLEFLSVKRNAFGKDEISAAILLAEQAGVSLSNAIRYRATEQEASTDWLTGLPTRRSFMARASVLASGFTSRVNVSTLMIDIDHFKQVNDGFGHAAGDVALTAMAALCREALRAEDLCCRYGGEEIVVLLPGADARVAMAAAERIRKRTEDLRIAEYPQLRLTVSIGVASGNGDDDFRELISRADEALYLAKQAGRNRSELR